MLIYVNLNISSFHLCFFLRFCWCETEKFNISNFSCQFAISKMSDLVENIENMDVNAIRDKADKDMLLKHWMDRVDIMLNDTTFRYTPNQYCRNCWFRRANGTNTCDAA